MAMQLGHGGVPLIGVCTVLQVGSLVTISSKEDIASAECLCDSDGKVVMDSTDWRIIPAGKIDHAMRNIRRAALASDDCCL